MYNPLTRWTNVANRPAWLGSCAPVTFQENMHVANPNRVPIETHCIHLRPGRNTAMSHHHANVSERDAIALALSVHFRRLKTGGVGTPEAGSRLNYAVQS